MRPLDEEGKLSERIFTSAVRRSENMRRNFFKERDLAIKTIRQKQQEAAKRVVEVQRTVQISNESLKARAKNIELRGPANQRIDRGLIGLEKLVQDLRDALMARSTADVMSLDPDIHKEIEAESRNIMKSKFFKTIMRQLKKEEDHA